MNLSDLLKQGLVEEFESDKQQIKNVFDLAVRDVLAAKKNLEMDLWDWAYAIAFNAMLSAGRALMFSKGYRAKSQEHHLAVTQFMLAVYSSKFPIELLEMFEKARKRRSGLLYDEQGAVSETQARTIVGMAEKFVEISKRYVKF